MKKEDCNTQKNAKEFTETDVKNIYQSIDEDNGFGIDFAINLYRINKQTPEIDSEIVAQK